MRSRKALFLGFCRSPFAGEPLMIVFYVEHLKAFYDLQFNHSLRGELVVVLSPFPELTSGDFFDTFPATRERNAGRCARAEFTYTNAAESSARLYDGRSSCAEEDSEVDRAVEVAARPAGLVLSGRERPPSSAT